ncbi:MAG: hypothetical protein RMM58_06870 [Chloroflexota bacterium]|nr:hypothetical protein [Dehalococcoidia bacterium]MDW8253584.1 hypothetical protein [Chloroflexota bacterium]
MATQRVLSGALLTLASRPLPPTAPPNAAMLFRFAPLTLPARWALPATIG